MGFDVCFGQLFPAYPASDPKKASSENGLAFEVTTRQDEQICPVETILFSYIAL